MSDSWQAFHTAAFCWYQSERDRESDRATDRATDPERTSVPCTFQPQHYLHPSYVCIVQEWDGKSCLKPAVEQICLYIYMKISFCTAVAFSLTVFVVSPL